MILSASRFLPLGLSAAPTPIHLGGSVRQRAAAYIKEHFDRPVVAFVAGRTAPPERRMGHAGAIISGSEGTAEEKVKILQNAGVHVVESPAEIGTTMKNVLQ